MHCKVILILFGYFVLFIIFCYILFQLICPLVAHLHSANDGRYSN